MTNQLCDQEEKTP